MQKVLIICLNYKKFEKELMAQYWIFKGFVIMPYAYCLDTSVSAFAVYIRVLPSLDFHSIFLLSRVF